MTHLFIFLFLSVMFILAVTIAYVIFNQLLPTSLQKRLHNLFRSTPTAPAVTEIMTPLSKNVRRWIEPLAGATMNAEQWLTSPLRIKFSNAGLNKPSDVTYYFAAKTLLAFAFPLLFFIGNMTFNWTSGFLYLLVAMGVCSVFGYFLPTGVLDRLVAMRQRELFLAFPDALDLLRVCVEAGLGLDAAVERVGREMQIESQALAQEFSLLGLELRAGAGRTDALRNLALRIGLKDIDTLVAMLIQADRFGTNMADSLLMHSESLRSKRRLAAEEAAAKLPVKILMPLIFCVFPALLTVLLGPAVINIVLVLAPRLVPQ
jgi:tight adherence protein C